MDKYNLIFFHRVKLLNSPEKIKKHSFQWLRVNSIVLSTA